MGSTTHSQSTQQKKLGTFAKSLVVVVLLAILLMAVWVVTLPNASLFNVINGVMASAIIGALLNQSQRADAASFQNVVWSYIVWKCLVALTFAVVLYLLFVAGIVTGPLFPAFQNSAAGFENFASFVQDVQPARNADVAKCLVWGFLAGYSERFVPNILDRIQHAPRDGGSKPPAENG